MSHRLLARQIERHLGVATVPPEWQRFIAAVDDAYTQFDDDRAMIERSMELSSEELLQANARLREARQELERRVEERTEDLRASEERFRVVAETAHDAIVTADEQGCIRYANQAAERIFGRPIQELLGSPVAGLVPERLRARYRQTIEHHRSAGETRHEGRTVELVGIRKDGEEFPIELSLATATTAAGPYFIGVLRDVTERKRNEEALRQAQKMESLGVLAGGVAHDFNNLLGAMLGYNSLALTKLPPENPVRAYVERSVNAVERAADLTRQMLAYAGKGRVRVEPFNLNTLIRENVYLFGGSAIPKNVQLVTRLADAVPMVAADVGQIQQVLMNLIINAAEAIGERNGTILISTGAADLTEADIAPWRRPGQSLEPGSYVRLVVEDDGPGIEEAILARIFDPFFTTKLTGRGLGLSAVQGIVRGHKGGLLVESAPGRGTAFHMVFPACQAVAPSEHPDPVTAPANGALILVVDDERELRDAVVAILSSGGFECLAAGDGRDGIEIFRMRHHEIRLVMLDVSMPGLSGVETFRELRKIDPQVRVLLCSGHDPLQAVPPPESSKAAGIIQKPFRSDALIRQIRQSLS